MSAEFRKATVVLDTSLSEEAVTRTGASLPQDEVVYISRNKKTITRGDVNRNGEKLQALLEEHDTTFQRFSGYLARKYGNVLEQEDILQEASLKILLHADTILPDGVTDPVGHVKQTMRNSAVDLYRKNRFARHGEYRVTSLDYLFEEQEGDQVIGESVDNVEEEVLSAITSEEIFHEIEEILRHSAEKTTSRPNNPLANDPELGLDIFRMSVDDGLTYAEISGKTGVHLATIKSHMRRLKEKLQSDDGK